MQVESQNLGARRSFNEDVTGIGQSLDVRIFNWVCLLVIFTGFATGALNVLVSNPMIELVYSITVIAVGCSCWLLSIKFHQSRRLRIPLVLFLLILLTSVWLTNQGYEGSTPYYLILLFNLAVIIVPASYRWYLFAVLLLWVLALYVAASAYPSLVRNYISPSVRFYDLGVSFFSCVAISALFFWLILREYENERDKNERLVQQSLDDQAILEELLSEINALKGILPICSYCKKIRDENDKWHSMEHYISSRSEAQFSHGLCPDCGKKHYDL